MKLHFDANLDYQLQAIEAVCDLFRGLEICRTESTVTRHPSKRAGSEEDLNPGPVDVEPVQLEMGLVESALGIGNRLALLDDEILKNLNAVQLREGLAPSQTWPPGTLRWRWRRARGRPTSTCGRSSS